ncbi:MAG: hypothetical protein DMG09_06060 [Acidobacteria bacterium]|nr:MAG: hypothetical protein DMG09_06060 [Acidobacteriota bacterium]
MQRRLTAQEIDTLQARRPELFEPPELTEEEWQAATSSRNGKRGSPSRFWTDAETWLSDSGLRSLTPWERDAFMRIRSLIWLRPGCSLPDKDRYMARALRTSVQVWRQLRLRLLTWKLLAKRDGLLWDPELLLQTQKAEEKSATASRNATQGWRRRRDNQSSHAQGQNGGKSLAEKNREQTDATRTHANSDAYNLEDL